VDTGERPNDEDLPVDDTPPVVISLLVPTRSRPQQVSELWSSAQEHASRPDEVELVLYIDDDDPNPVDASNLLGRVQVVYGERIVLSEMWNECWRRALGDIFMHCGDDIRFRTSMWDLEVRNAFDRYPDGIVFVHGDDGYWGDKLGTHGFLSRRWTEVVGTFCPPYFSSDYNDAWFTDVARELGRKVYLPNVVTEHMHPAFGKGELDQTHRDRLERGQRDNVDQLYVELAPEREEWVRLLRAVLSVP
jgi:hypothetical protein